MKMCEKGYGQYVETLLPPQSAEKPTLVLPIAPGQPRFSRQEAVVALVLLTVAKFSALVHKTVL